MLRVLKRLLRSLGLQRPSHRTFELDAGLLPGLRELARREQRPAEELAADLLSDAIDRRRRGQDSLARWEALTPRQKQVAALACLGYTNEQIAVRLVISSETVKTHVRAVLVKFGVRSKAQLRSALEGWDFAAWDSA